MIYNTRLQISKLLCFLGNVTHALSMKLFTLSDRVNPDLEITIQKYLLNEKFKTKAQK